MAEWDPAWAAELWNQLVELLTVSMDDESSRDQQYEFTTAIHEWAVRNSHIGDRHAGYLVVLDQTFREDYAQSLTRLLCLIEGVVSVVPIESDYHQQIGAERVRGEVARQLFELASQVGGGR